MEKRVGDLPITSTHEFADFSFCHEDYIYQDYQINTDYAGGKRAIKSELEDIFPINTLTESGLLTIRFIVNCKGETGIYRSKMIDSSLEEVDISNKDLTQIYTAISALDRWKPGSVRGEPADSYYQVSFKLLNGEVIDIF